MEDEITEDLLLDIAERFELLSTLALILSKFDECNDVNFTDAANLGRIFLRDLNDLYNRYSIISSYFEKEFLSKICKD